MRYIIERSDGLARLGHEEQDRVADQDRKE
jgi:hypothetical protein